MYVVIEKGGKRFETKLKIQCAWSILFRTGILIYMKNYNIKAYFIPCRSFDASNSAGNPSGFAHQAICMVHLWEICLFVCFLFTAIFFSKLYHCTSFKLDLLLVSFKLYLSRFYFQIFSRWIMWYFSNTTSCVYWIIYADYSFRAIKQLKSQNHAAKQD